MEGASGWRRSFLLITRPGLLPRKLFNDSAQNLGGRAWILDHWLPKFKAHTFHSAIYLYIPQSIYHIYLYL